MEINKTFSSVEKSFNVAATIPLVAVPAAMLRVTIAEIQMVAAAALGLLGLIGQMVGANLEKWEEITQGAKEQLIHGVLNFIRGLGELFLGLTVVGSLGLLTYQAIAKNKFNPIYKYSS